MRIKSKLRVEVMKVISYPTLVSVEVTTCPDGWVVGFMIIMQYSTQLMLELKLELSLAQLQPQLVYNY